MARMEAGYETFDHTADLGIRVRATSLPELLGPAAEGLYAAIGELVGIGEPLQRSIDLSGPDAATLLRDYLTELLVLFEQEQCVVTVTSQAFTEERLTATLQTRRIDPEASVFDREVKAVTYHALAIRPIPGGLEATVIVDI